MYKTHPGKHDLLDPPFALRRITREYMNRIRRVLKHAQVIRRPDGKHKRLGRAMQFRDVISIEIAQRA